MFNENEDLLQQPLITPPNELQNDCIINELKIIPKFEKETNEYPTNNKQSLGIDNLESVTYHSKSVKESCLKTLRK